MTSQKSFLMAFLFLLFLIIPTSQKCESLLVPDVKLTPPMGIVHCIVTDPIMCSSTDVAGTIHIAFWGYLNSSVAGFDVYVRQASDPSMATIVASHISGSGDSKSINTATETSYVVKNTSGSYPSITATSLISGSNKIEFNISATNSPIAVASIVEVGVTAFDYTDIVESQFNSTSIP